MPKGRKKTQYRIRIVQASGPKDLASELEGQFLLSQLGLSLDQAAYGAGVIQKAEVDFHRCSSPSSLVNALADPAPTILHLIAHANPTRIEVGLTHISRVRLEADTTRGDLKGSIVLTTACEIGKGAEWKEFFLDHLGATALICAKSQVRLPDCAFFTSCFYGAFLGMRNGNKKLLDAAWDSFRIGYAAYRSLIASHTGFFFYSREQVAGKKLIGPLSLP